MHHLSPVLVCSPLLLLSLAAQATDALSGENRPTQSPTTLDRVSVIAHRDRLSAAYTGEQIARGAGVGMLGQQDFMDTPFSVTGYTQDYIQNLQATDIGHVLNRADASIYTAQQRGLQETFMVRGFYLSGFNDLYFNGLAGMAPIMRGSTEMAERIEVQKGPSASLSGMSPGGAVGGRINLVAKRAGDMPLKRANLTAEADSLFGLHADIGQRWGAHQQWGLRVNGVLRDGDTAIDDQQQRMGLGALALDWRGTAWQLSADVYRQRERLDGVSYFAINRIGPAVTQVPAALDGSKNLAPSWAFNINTTEVAMARMEGEISAHLSAWASYGRNHATYNTRIIDSNLLDNSGALLNMPVRQYQSLIVHSGEAGLHGTFSSGSLRHTWTLAANRYDSRFGLNRSANSPRFTHLSVLDFGDTPDFNGFTTGQQPSLAFRTRLDGIALADQISSINERAQVTFGLRRQRIDVTPSAFTPGYDQSTWSPTIALLLKPQQSLSLYASYIQGLSQGGTAPATAANAFESLAPYKSEQHELGLKADWEQIAFTAAAFQITLPSAQTDPISNIYAATGEQRNRGFELNLFGEVKPGLRLLGGSTWLQADLRKQNNPALNGNQAPGAPRFITRIGVEYDLPTWLDLAITGHVNHVGKRWFTTDNRLSASSYTTLDLGARYSARLAGIPIALRAAVSNLFNHHYWAGSPREGLGFLGAPRAVLLSVSFDFQS